METNNLIRIQFEESVKFMGFNNTSDLIEDFSEYHRLILEWNSKINLISSNSVDDIFERHFLDSLSVHLVNTIFKGNSNMDFMKVLDVGTGAGLPGIPLKIVMPKLKLTLLDATSKKIDFLKIVCSELLLSNVDFILDRAERAAHLKPYRGDFDLVVSRAVADLKILVEFMIPFCKTGGLIVAMKGEKAEQEVKEALPAIRALGGDNVEIIDSSSHHPFLKGRLVVIRKVAETPSNYPRRVGIPHKRPLTGLS